MGRVTSDQGQPALGLSLPSVPLGVGFWALSLDLQRKRWADLEWCCFPTGCVTWGKGPHLSETQIPHVEGTPHPLQCRRCKKCVPEWRSFYPEWSSCFCLHALMPTGHAMRLLTGVSHCQLGPKLQEGRAWSLLCCCVPSASTETGT